MRAAACCRERRSVAAAIQVKWPPSWPSWQAMMLLTSPARPSIRMAADWFLTTRCRSKSRVNERSNGARLDPRLVMGRALVTRAGRTACRPGNLFRRKDATPSLAAPKGRYQFELELPRRTAALEGGGNELPANCNSAGRPHSPFHGRRLSDRWQQRCIDRVTDRGRNQPLRLLELGPHGAVDLRRPRGQSRIRA